MNEIRIIEAALDKTARRKRWQDGWRGFWRGLLVGSIVWLVTLAVFKLFPVPPLVLAVAAAVAGGAMALGLIIGLRQRRSLLETARWVDQKKKLQERLSTALEIAEAPRAAHWRQLLVSDAAKHADQINPKELLPYHLPPASRWVLLTLVLAVGLGFAPEYRSQKYLGKPLL